MNILHTWTSTRTVEQSMQSGGGINYGEPPTFRPASGRNRNGLRVLVAILAGTVLAGCASTIPEGYKDDLTPEENGEQYIGGRQALAALEVLS